METSLGREKATGLKEEPSATFCALQTSCSNSSKQAHSRRYSRPFPIWAFKDPHRCGAEERLRRPRLTP